MILDINEINNEEYWILLLAKEFDIDISEIIELKDQGMNYESAYNYLNQKYPFENTELSENDYEAKAIEFEVSIEEIKKIYTIARKYGKDPEWLVNRFKEIQNLSRLENALQRRNAMMERIIRMNLEGKPTGEDITNIIFQIYEANVSEFSKVIDEKYKQEGIYNLDILDDIIFFMDLNSEEELIFDIEHIFLADEDELINLPEEFIDVNKKWPKRIETSTSMMSVRPMAASNTITTTTLDLSFMTNGADENSPFKSGYHHIDEYIDSSTGSLSLGQTDFTLPGKNNFDFNFTRVYQGNDYHLEYPVACCEEIFKGWRITGGSYTNKRLWDSGSGKDEQGEYTWEIWIYETFTYNDQSYDEGYVYGILTVEFVTEKTGRQSESKDGGSSYQSGPPSPDSEVYPDMEYIYYLESTLAESTDIFGLGKGWTLDLPYLKRNGSDLCINFGSGGSYKVGKDGYLENMGGKIYSVIQNGSGYIMRSKNGITWHFNLNGNLLTIKDKFDSQITLAYNQAKVSYIIDSVGRKIAFSRNDYETIVSVYESATSSEPLNVWKYMLEDTKAAGHKKLSEVIPPAGESTKFFYNDYNLYYSKKGYGNIFLAALHLGKVKRPTGATSSYMLQSYTKNSYDNTVTMLRTIRREDLVPSITLGFSGPMSDSFIENKVEFIFNTTDTKSTTRNVTRAENELGELPCREYWEFDAKNRVILHRIIGQNYEDKQQEIIETINEYIKDKDKHPSRVIKTITVGNKSRTEINSFSYDEYGNIISHTDNVGKITEYTYESNFNICTRILETFIDGTKKMTNYTVDPEFRTVTEKEEGLAEIYYTKINDMVTEKASNLNKSTSYFLNPSCKVWDITFQIYWKAGWPLQRCQYIIEYKRPIDPVWMEAHRSNVERGKLLAKREGTDTVNVVFPQPDYYQVRIRQLYGSGRVESATIHWFQEHVRFLGHVAYEKYDYDPNHLGNLVSISKFDFGATFTEAGSLLSKADITYDKSKAYPEEVSMSVKDINGNPNIYKVRTLYDELGRVTSKSAYEGEYDDATFIVYYEYDELGRITKATNPPRNSDGQTTSIVTTYVDDKKEVIVTELTSDEVIGARKRRLYDGMGRIVYSEWFDLSDKAHMIKYVKYDSLGMTVSSTDAKRNETKYKYDAFGREISVLRPNGSTLKKVFMDVYTEPIAIPNSPSNFINLPYSRWTKIEDGNGNPLYQAYDIAGNLVWSASNPRIASQDTSSLDMCWYQYDAQGRITKSAINRTAKEWDITECEYVLNGIKTMFSSPSIMKLPGDTEPQYVYEYDSRGLKTKEYQVNDVEASISFKYDELGRIISVEYPLKREYMNDSSVLGNAEAIFNPVEIDVTRRTEMYYNLRGLIRTDSYMNEEFESSVSFDYDNRGWKTGESWNIYGEVYKFCFDYDNFGNMTQMIYPDNSDVNYTYDEAYRLKSIPKFFENGDDRGFVYDICGNLKDIWAVNGIHTEFSYNAFNMVKMIDSDPLKLDYIYDLSGNISKITDLSNIQDPIVWDFQYDKKGQLEFSRCKRGNKTYNLLYSYDGAGNRINEARGIVYATLRDYLFTLGKKFNENWNAVEDYHTYTCNYFPGSYLNSRKETTNDEIAEIGYTWDSSGQLASKSTGEAYIFNSKKQLTAVLKDDVIKEVYSYDALGRRIKSVNSTELNVSFPLGNGCGYEIKKDIASGEETKTKYISVNGKYLAKIVEKNGLDEQKYFHHVDLGGSIRAITDEGGNIIASYEYEPFGCISSSSGTDCDNLGFGGKKLDYTGLSCFGARYYDAEIGRFISRDPAFDGRNWFSYCANNPLKYIDPNGCKIRPVPYVSDFVESLYKDSEDYQQIYLPREIQILGEFYRVKTFLTNEIIGFKQVYEYLDGLANEISVYLADLNYGTSEKAIDLNFINNRFGNDPRSDKEAFYCIIEEFVHAYEIQIYLNNPDKEYRTGDLGYTGMLYFKYMEEKDPDIKLALQIEIELLTQGMISDMLDKSGIDWIPRYPVYQIGSDKYTYDSNGNVIKL